MRTLSIATLVLARQPDGKYSLVFLVAGNYPYEPMVLLEGPAVDYEHAAQEFVNVVADDVMRAVEQCKKKWAPVHHDD
jgi:hypothetical protein